MRYILIEIMCFIFTFLINMYSHSSCVKINPYKNSTIAYTNKQKFRSSDTLPKSIKIYGENFSHKNNNTNYRNHNVWSF